MGATPKKKKPGRPRDETLPSRRREEIVRHAILEFAQRGYAGTDLDDIARRAGCAKGTLYNYFKNKGDLFSASVDHVMFSMVNAIAVPEDADPIDAMETAVRGFLQHFADHPHYVELLVQERSDFRDRSQPTYYQYRKTSLARWEKRLMRLMKTGRMRQIPPAHVMNILSDTMYGTIFMNYFRAREFKPDDQARQILDILLGGLLTPAEFARYQKRDK